jgi:hypothetical protein
MSHGQEKCVFCRAKLNPALENRSDPGGWVKLTHFDRYGNALVESVCLRHTGVAKTLCQQTIPSMLSGVEGNEVPDMKLEAALVVMRSRKAVRVES